MTRVLAERRFTVTVAGQPSRSMRATIAQPVKLNESCWGVTVSIHDPPDGPAVVERELYGVDAWQALQIAFRILPVLVDNHARDGATLTFLGEDNWSGQRPT